jgi:hypothetical protein
VRLHAHTPAGPRPRRAAAGTPGRPEPPAAADAPAPARPVGMPPAATVAAGAGIRKKLMAAARTLPEASGSFQLGRFRKLPTRKPPEASGSFWLERQECGVGRPGGWRWLAGPWTYQGRVEELKCSAAQVAERLAGGAGRPGERRWRAGPGSGRAASGPCPLAARAARRAAGAAAPPPPPPPPRGRKESGLAGVGYSMPG